MSLYARSLELTGITHSGFGLEVNNGYDNSYGIRGGCKVNSGTATNWIGIATGLDGGPYSGTFWHRGFCAGINGSPAASGRTFLEYSASGTPVFRLQFTANDTLQPQYWDGSAWTNIGTTVSIPSTGSPKWKYDLKIVCGASFEFYITNNMSVEPTLQSSGSASMTLVTGIDGIKAYSTNGSAGGCMPHSEWIWGDEATTGIRYAWAPPTGDGTYTAGSGAFGDVDEAITDDADLSTLTNNGDAETYTHSAMSIPATALIKAVQVEARVRNAATGAQNVKMRIRVGGTDYDAGANFAGIGTSFGPYVYQWATNPAGGSWTVTTAGQTSNEFGTLAQT